MATRTFYRLPAERIFRSPRSGERVVAQTSIALDASVAPAGEPPYSSPPPGIPATPGASWRSKAPRERIGPRGSVSEPRPR